MTLLFFDYYRVDNTKYYYPEVIDIVSSHLKAINFDQKSGFLIFG